MPEPDLLDLSAIEFRQATLEEILDLRHRILRAGLPRETALWSGDHDEHTRHFAALHQGQVVACASLLLTQWEGQPAWQLRGMAAAENFRRRGLGRRLLQLLEHTAQQAHLADRIWCNARTPALGFYRKQGWQTVGEEFVIESAGPHYKMLKDFPHPT